MDTNKLALVWKHRVPHFGNQANNAFVEPIDAQECPPERPCNECNHVYLLASSPANNAMTRATPTKTKSYPFSSTIFAFIKRYFIPELENQSTLIVTFLQRWFCPYTLCESREGGESSQTLHFAVVETRKAFYNWSFSVSRSSSALHTEFCWRTDLVPAVSPVACWRLDGGSPTISMVTCFFLETSVSAEAED